MKTRMNQKLVRFPAQNQVKTKKKRSSLKFSPVFGPKIGEDQKKGLHSNLVRFLAQDQVKTKKRASLKFNPVLGPKLGKG